MIINTNERILTSYCRLFPNVDKVINTQRYYNGDIVINTEQLSREDQRKIIQSYNVPIIDYSYKNLSYLKNKNTYMFPFIFDSKYLWKFSPKNYIYDVIFFGCKSDRRMKIINELKSRGVKVAFLQNIYNDDMNRIIFNSKIMLNIHYADDYKVFEFLRCLEPMYNKIVVVSEDTDITLERQCETYNYMLDFVNFTSYDKITDKVIEILNDFDTYQHKSNSIDYNKLSEYANYEKEKFNKWISSLN